MAYIGVSLWGLRMKPSLASLHARKIIVSMTTLLWCGRIGSFLAYIINMDKKDSRFDKIKTNPIRFGTAWFLQGVWCFLTAYPVYYINTCNPASLARLNWLDAVGITFWIIGFGFEAIADWQKLAWASRVGHERRKTEFINEGLWHILRHPNYLGRYCCGQGLSLLVHQELCTFQC